MSESLAVVVIRGIMERYKAVWDQYNGGATRGLHIWYVHGSLIHVFCDMNIDALCSVIDPTRIQQVHESGLLETINSASRPDLRVFHLSLIAIRNV